ncbi:MAG: thiol:disulfide interchange protein DsbA/DsbL [Methylophilaceae bacterium]|nr:thiol:disulfide interchange protein DsbA/DsbL [Methylophilaceae bacterium]
MKSLMTALLLLFASATCAAEPRAGAEYLPVQPALPTDSPDKIEVTELFWYGCPHCHQLEPTLAAWVKKLPKDVEFKRVPGIARPDWAPGAKAYYTMEALGLTEKLHAALFDAIHKQRAVRPNDDAGLIDWIARQGGLDRKKVEETYNSFSVNTKMMRASQLFRASGATGVPSLVIGGRFLTSSTLAGGNEAALKTADYLIDKLRKEK